MRNGLHSAARQEMLLVATPASASRRLERAVASLLRPRRLASPALSAQPPRPLCQLFLHGWTLSAALASAPPPAISMQTRIPYSYDRRFWYWQAPSGLVFRTSNVGALAGHIHQLRRYPCLEREIAIGHRTFAARLPRTPHRLSSNTFRYCSSGAHRPQLLRHEKSLQLSPG